MEKNWKKKLKNSQGITLVALVVTIIVLLILAGVSLSAVFSQDGIFRRAEQATDKHGQAKARETLELALGEAQMQKYEEGLTDEQLTNKINEIGEEIEERETPDISQAIVDGYIFSVDRTVPKILDYLGPADGIIITAKVSGNGGWFKQGDTVNVTVTGKIKTYSGGNITTVSATKGGTAITGFSIDAEGRYTIDNITADTTIVINAEDSKDKKGSKTVPITIRIDTIAPVVDTIDTSKTKGLIIRFSATGHDNESGLKHFNYTISSTQDTDLEGIPENKRTGTFKQGEIIEIITTPVNNKDEATYKIIIVATDNAGNTSTDKTANVTVIDGITVAEAKNLTAETIRENIGKRVTDYNPKGGGIYRVFYQDNEDGDSGNGYFECGKRTVFLKRDYEVSLKKEPEKSNKQDDTDPAVIMMRKMNPLWKKSGYSSLKYTGERVCIWLCDDEIWKDYRDENSSFALGGTSLEMYVKAFNLWKTGNPNGNAMYCGIFDSNGYASDLELPIRGNHPANVGESGPYGVFVPGPWKATNYAMMCSPYCGQTSYCFSYRGDGAQFAYTTQYPDVKHYEPVVPLDL